MELLNKFVNLLKIDEPSDHPDFYEGLNWVTFNPDLNVFNTSYQFKGDKMQYIRKITHCYLQLMEELKDNKLNTNSELRQIIREKDKTISKLQKEIARCQGTIEQLKSQLGKSQEWQTSAGLKNQVREVVGLDPIFEAEKETDQSGRYTSNDGYTGIQKRKIIYEAKHYGYDYIAVAKELGVYKSLHKYMSEARKNCRHAIMADGSEILVWQGEYDLPKHSIDGIVPVPDREKTRENVTG